MADDKRISPAEIQKALRDVEYPATKEQLLEKAHENDADEEVIRTIEGFPTEEFGGPQDVMKAYGNEE